MKQEILINGRQALPVRVLPFSAPGVFTPDLLVEAFVERVSWFDLTTYELSNENGHHRLRPDDWDPYWRRILELSDRLWQERRSEREFWMNLVQQGVPLLPEGTFVFFDELEAIYSKVGDSLLHQLRRYQRSVRPRMPKLSLAPKIPHDLRDVCLEGFTHLIKSGR